MRSQENILANKDRKTRVFEAILHKPHKVMDFDRIVEVTGFCRNEVSMHLAVLARQFWILKGEDDGFVYALTLNKERRGRIMKLCD